MPTFRRPRGSPKSHTQEGVGYASAEVQPRNFRLEAVLQANRGAVNVATQIGRRTYAARECVGLQVVVLDVAGHDVRLGLLGQSMVVARTNHLAASFARITAA